jgi:hypothetical protein
MSPTQEIIPSRPATAGRRRYHTSRGATTCDSLGLQSQDRARQRPKVAERRHAFSGILIPGVGPTPRIPIRGAMVCRQRKTSSPFAQRRQVAEDITPVAERRHAIAWDFSPRSEHDNAPKSRSDDMRFRDFNPGSSPRTIIGGIRHRARLDIWLGLDIRFGLGIRLELKSVAPVNHHPTGKWVRP